MLSLVAPIITAVARAVFEPLAALNITVLLAPSAVPRWLQVPIRIARAIGNVIALCMGAHILLLIHILHVLPFGDESNETGGIAGLARQPNRRTLAERRLQDMREMEAMRWGHRPRVPRPRLLGPDEVLANAARGKAMSVLEALQRRGGMAAACVNALHLLDPAAAPMSPLWRTLPPELATMILMHAASPDADEPMPLVVSLVSKVHARLLQPRLYTHLALRSPRSTHAARLTLALHKPAVGASVRTAHLCAPHASATEQLLLASPNLQALALTATTHDSLALSPGARLSGGAKPRMLLLSCIPATFPVFSKVEHACIVLRSLDARGAKLIRDALPSLRTLEICYAPATLHLEELAHAWSPHGRAWREIAALAEAARFLRAPTKPLEGLTMRLPPRAAGALSRKVPDAVHGPAAKYDTSANWICVEPNGDARESQHIPPTPSDEETPGDLTPMRIIRDSSNAFALEDWSRARTDALWT